MKYIIFDIDGTLTDTKNVDDRCFIDAFDKTFGLNIYNYNWAELKNVTDWGITEEIIENNLNRKPKPQEYELMISTHVQLLEKEKQKDKSQFKEVKGAKQFFDYLKSKNNHKLGIATGAWEKSANIKLDSIDIDPTKHAFSNSDYFKSREEITNNCIQQIKNSTNTEPKEIIYFGDGLWDYKTCKNLGIKFIGIDILGDNVLKSAGAKTVFRDFSKVEEILKVL